MIVELEATFHFSIGDLRAMSWRDVCRWHKGHRDIIADILGRKGLA